MNDFTFDGTLTLSPPYDPNAQVLVVYAAPPGGQRAVMTFFADGRIEVGDFARPSDAARQIIAALADLLPGHIRRPEVTAESK